MNLSAMMNAQTSQLQHTLSMNLIQSSLSTQAAQSIHMLESMNENKDTVKAPHPVSGSQIDISL